MAWHNTGYMARDANAMGFVAGKETAETQYKTVEKIGSITEQYHPSPDGANSGNLHRLAWLLSKDAEKGCVWILKY
jgi:hypothetical protein